MSHKPTPYEAAKQYLGCTPEEALRATNSEDVGFGEFDALLLEQLWIGLHTLRIRPAPQRAWQKRMRSEGRCVICGKPSPTLRCQEHRRARKKP